ncbi:MAG: hypothetical protein ABEJ82_06015 [Haloplanus sp.]
MGERPWGYVVLTLGAVVLASAVWHLFVLDASETSFHHLISMLMVGGSGATLLYGGYRHVSDPFDSERYPVIAGWMAATTVLFVGVSVVTLYSGSRTVRPVELERVVHIAASVGVATGLFVGSTHADALRNAEAASRSEAEAAALAAEQERLERLNELLRHYILNGMNVIQGYSAQLRDDVPPGHHAKLDVIEERTAAIVTLVDHVRLVSGVGPEGSTVDLGRAVDAAVDDIDAAVTVLRSGRELPPVRADQLTEALALLFDALTTVVGADGTIRLDETVSDERVTLSITATPVAFPSGTTDPLVDLDGSRSSLKFHLVRSIVDQYGDLRLVEASDGRLRFELTLDRAVA